MHLHSNLFRTNLSKRTEESPFFVLELKLNFEISFYDNFMTNGKTGKHNLETILCTLIYLKW